MKKIIFLFLVIVVHGNLFSQVNINGKVTDIDSNPLPGVNVIVKGTQQGTVTDFEGNYSLGNVSADAILVFSFLGMLPEEVKVGSQTTINVLLIEDMQNLDEVVVVGYGSVKRANLAGAVTDINAEELQDIPVANLSSALEGRLSGVRISKASGRPGAATKFQIRESAAKNIAEQVLYVIDGIIRDQEAFDLLDPSEVESISVLKDASAAVYGAAAAGGVVLVTTKRGREGKMKINYSSSFGVTQAINETEMLSAYEHAKLVNDKYTIYGYTEPFSDQALTFFRDSLPGGGYDWLDQAWHNALVARHSLNFSGGTDKIKYFIGGNAFRENGNIDNLWVKKHTLRSNIEAEIIKDLTVRIEASTSYKEARIPINPSDKEEDILEETFKALLENPKFIPPTINGYPYLDQNYISNNPYAIWEVNDYKRSEINSFTTTASINYKFPFLEGLSANFSASQTKRNGFYKTYKTPAYAYEIESGQDDYIIRSDAVLSENPKIISSSSSPSLQESMDRSYSYQTNTSISYKRKFGKHEINAIGVCEVSEWESRTSGWKMVEQEVEGYDEMWAWKTDADGNEALLSVPKEGGSLGYIGRLNYNYGSKYIGEFAFRYESSTRFIKEERWGFFPSVLVGWVISEENFFEKILPVVNFLKLRASAGLLGNDKGIGEFTYVLRYGAVDNDILFGGNNKELTALAVEAKNEGVVSEDVRWQESQSYNLGLDMRFLDNRISFSADGFYELTTNMLENVGTLIPTTSGLSHNNKVYFNYGKAHSYGLEFEMGINGKLPFGLEYEISPNFSWAEARLLEVAQSPSAVGKWYDELKNFDSNQPGAISTGIIRNEKEIENILMDNPNYTIGGEPIEEGILNYKDLRGTDGSEGPNGRFNFDQEEDRTIIAKKTSAPYYYGMNLKIKYKFVSVDMTFSGRFGHQVVFDKNATEEATERKNVPAFWEDHWTPENKDAKYPRAGDYKLVGKNSTFWLRNGHTLRLTDLNLSTSLPSTWSNKLNLSSIRFFFNTKYLWTIINPFEYKDANLSKFNGYPMTRTYNFGINLSY